MNGAEAIARILKKEGAEYLFCFPMNALIDPLAELGVRPILVRTERTAVAMADGYTRVSNGKKTGLVGVQSGPGIENAFGGIAQAFSDSTPILVLAGQEMQRRLGQNPNFDAIDSLRSITKWAIRINMVERIPELMRRAFTYLRMGRPGPVLLEIPDDVAEAEIADEAILQYRVVRPAYTSADPTAVARAIEALLKAKRPLIHAGLGVLYAEAWDELREFAELTQVPVMASLSGKSVFPEDHPLYIGSGGRSGLKSTAQVLKEADLIFSIGSSLTASLYATPFPKDKMMVQSTVDERDVNKDYGVDHVLLGDAKLVLRQCIEEVKRQTSAHGKPRDDSLIEALAQLKNQALDIWMPKLTDDQTPMNPYRVIWELRKSVDSASTIITHDSGTPRDMLAPIWSATRPRGYVGWGKSTHLGWGLGLAMGAKLASPERTVVNVMGDAAFGMTGLELETAARNKIPIMTILFNNGIMSKYPGFYPIATTRYGFSYLSGDYCQIALGLGAYAETVLRPEDIGPAVERAQRAMSDGKPALLEMKTREETQLPIHWDC